jgi:hypothetical protein
MVVFDRGVFEKGDYVDVMITDCTSATLLAQTVDRAVVTARTDSKSGGNNELLPVGAR